MRTIWHSLAWKEWHEHKWKLASITAILWGVTLLVFLSEDREREQIPLAAGMAIFCSVPLAVFVGLGSAAGERSRDTMRFLEALPVPLGRVALHKLAFGLVTAILPVILTLLLILGWWFRLLALDESRAVEILRQGAPFTNNLFIAWALLAICLVASLYVWAAAMGVNRKDEVSAGAVALTAMVGWWLMLVMLWSILLLRSTSVETVRLRAAAAATAPGGIVPLSEITDAEPVSLLIGFITGFLTHGILATWFVRRFGRLAETDVRSQQPAILAMQNANWLAPPRRSAFTAIAWKQFRESAPIALIGVTGIVAIVVIVIAASWPEKPGFSPKEAFDFYAGVSVALGIVIALVIGIGVCLYDTSPRLNTFWQSRPIHADAWFWTKYVTGLVILVISIYLPLVVVAWGVQLHTSVDIRHPDVVVFPLVHIAVFAAAVAMTCLVRHAVYAAILSLPLVYAGVLLVWLASLIGGMLGWWGQPVESLYDLTEQHVAAGMLLSFIVSTIVAWLAMRYDWGRTSRY